MSSVCPGGRTPGKPGENIGEYRGHRLDSLPLGEGKIQNIGLVGREEGGGIANFVKSQMVTTGISQRFIAKRIL